MRQSYTDFSSTTPLTTIPVTHEATIATEISSSDFSSVEPLTSTSVPTAPDSTTPTMSSGHMQESQDPSILVPKDLDNVSAFGIGNKTVLLHLTKIFASSEIVATSIIITHSRS